MPALISLGGLFLLALALVVANAAYQVVKYRFFHPLRHFPGPWLGSVTRLWITYHNLRGDECQTFRALHERHGPVIRITPTMLLVSDATKLPEIYSRNADKSQHYITGSFSDTESLFNMQDHRVHAHFRRIAAAPYSFSNVKRMEPLIDANLDRWIARLDDCFAAPRRPVDFAPWAVYVAYDVISELGFGRPFGFIDQGRDVEGLIKGFHDGLVPFGVMARLWPLTNLLKRSFLGRYLVATPEQDSGIGTLMRFRDRLIAQRLDDKAAAAAAAAPRVDLLQTFLDARDGDGRPLPLDQVRAEVLLVLLAGADTTGTTMQALVLHVLSHPDVHARLAAELDAAVRAGAVSAAAPQYDDVLAHCPYYVACVREAMRLTPAAPNIFPRLAPPGGLVLFGRRAPAGTELTCNPWLVHRDPAVVGPDPDAFRPERWLEDPEVARDLLKYSMAFGYGPRECLGKHIALMELFKGPLRFFLAFKADIVNPERPARYLVKGGVSYFEDMWLNIEKRPQLV